MKKRTYKQLSFYRGRVNELRQVKGHSPLDTSQITRSLQRDNIYTVHQMSDEIERVMELHRNIAKSIYAHFTLQLQGLEESFRICYVENEE